MPHFMSPSRLSEATFDVLSLVTKLGGAGDRFGDYSWVDCANLLNLSYHLAASSVKHKHKIHHTYYKIVEVYLITPTGLTA